MTQKITTAYKELEVELHSGARLLKSEPFKIGYPHILHESQ